MEVHPKSFQPSLVSIGPYHHGEQQLQMIEEHKWRILHGNLGRLKTFKVTLHDLLDGVAIEEKAIRKCYSENIDKYTSHQLIEMMLLDSGFIIELLCVANHIIIPKPDDPIFGFPWMFSSLTRDLLMLENQIPFLVLQIVYAKSISDHLSVPSLQELILKLFDYSVPRYVDVNILCRKYKNYNGKHILDFYRSTFLPWSEKDEKEKAIYRCCNCQPGLVSSHKQTTTGRRDSAQSLPEIVEVGDDKSSFQFIPPVEKLRKAGIKFKQREEEGVHSFLDIKFKHGILEIPCLATTEIMSPLMLNCIAFEQCSKDSSKHFTSYFNFMGCLINTTVDAQYLRQKKIIENLFGTDGELVNFFNNVGKNITYYFEEDYLMKECKKMEIYYRRVWRVRFVKFLSKYYGSPRIIMGALLLIILYEVITNASDQ